RVPPQRSGGPRGAARGYAWRAVGRRPVGAGGGARRGGGRIGRRRGNLSEGRSRRQQQDEKCCFHDYFLFGVTVFLTGGKVILVADFPGSGPLAGVLTAGLAGSDAFLGGAAAGLAAGAETVFFAGSFR